MPHIRRAPLRVSRRRGTLATLIVLVALVGGIASGSLAAARRTASSYDRLLASTHPSDILVVPLLTGPAVVGERNLQAIRHLPEVTHLATSTNLSVIPLGAGDTPSGVGDDVSSQGVFPVASRTGMFDTRDRPRIVSGRMLDPRRPDEFVASGEAARTLHMRVGQTIRLGLYDQAKTAEPGYGTAAVKPTRIVEARLVGIADFFGEVIQDDADRVPTYVLFSPAMGRALDDTPFLVGLTLAHGASDVPRVEAAIRRIAPTAAIVNLAEVRAASANRAIEPDALALAGFGVIASLATFLIAAQVVGRAVRASRRDLEIIRSLGADRAMLLADGAVEIVVAVALGAVLAAIVAVALSPLSPIGPVRPVEVASGVSVDWLVLGPGVAALTLLLGGYAVITTYRALPNARRKPRTNTGALRGRLTMTRYLPLAAWTGLRLAWRPRSKGETALVVPAVLGATLAIAVLLATQVFGASLNTLVTHPNLYGWNWNVELRSSYGGVSNIGTQVADQVLSSDHEVENWSGAYFYPATIDHLVVPAIGMRAGSSVAPPILSGRPVETNDQVALGASTLAELHKHVGDTVSVVTDGHRARAARIVGTTTLPAVGSAATVHTEMAVGALLPSSFTPSDAGLGRHDGPEAIFVRFRAGTDERLDTRQLTRIAPKIQSTDPKTDPDADGPPTVLTTQRPAEIVNYRSMGTTPALLAGALAVAATLALGLTLVAAVRSLRRDFAVLQAIGFTRRQIGAAVAWHATFTIGAGTIIGIPLGIIGGRWLWDLFAAHINVQAHPTVPVLLIAAVALAALTLANLIATVPRSIAMSTRPSTLFRTE